MEFGRLPNVDSVDFTLPADDPRNADALAGSSTPGRVLLGTAGWSDKRFVGPLYPPRTKSSEFGKCVRFHRSSMIWCERTPPS